MSSPVRSVAVRLSLDPTSYVAGAAKAEQSTLALDGAVAKVGGSTVTNMDKAAKGAAGAETAFGKLNKTAGALGFTMGGLAGVGATVGAAMSVKWAADYQSGLTKLVTTAGESQKNIGMVGKGLLDMAGQVGIAAGELAKGAYIAESAGFHGADALNVMKAAAQGAKQENADLGKVTDAVSTVLHDYHLKASDAATVTSQLVTAVSHGKTNFDELTGSLHSVTPLAAKMNISLADVTGTLASMTASGESADQATQNMANTLQHLAAPTQGMISELAQLGISTDDLANSLSQNGLAGTLQMVETAIVNHLDPATQRVLLPALNQSKTATQDLQIMIGKMPASLASMSRALLDGSGNIHDYRGEVQAMGGQAGAMGLQFLKLLESSQGFNNVLKAGGPSAQVFTAAMQKAFGTTAALNVALQTTGENAGATTAAIKDIARATGDAQGNIKGWSEVQGTFNQKLAEAEAGIKSLAIEAGQHLLPALTSALGWVANTGVPAVEHLGSAVGDTAHWFSQLPAPIKDTALALGALKIADLVGLTGRLSSGVGAVKASFTGLREEMVLQQALWAANQRSAALAAVTYGDTAGALAVLTAAEERNTAQLGGLNAATSTLAIRGIGGLKAAGSGLLSMLGGPWGVAFLGATLAVTALINDTERYDEKIKQATLDVQKWNEAQALGSGGPTAVQAAQHLDDLKKKLADVTDRINAYNAAAAGGYARGGIGTLVTQQKELQQELAQGSQAWKDQLAAMTPVEEAQGRYDIALHDLNMLLKQTHPNQQEVTNAEIRLHDAQANLNAETDRANNAQKTQIQRLQDQATAALGLLGAQRASQLSQMQLADAIDQYNSDAKDGQHTTRQLQEEQIGLANSAQQTAQAAADAAAAQAKQNGATDTGSASQAAFAKSLQETAAHLTGDAKQAVLDMITTMGAQATQAGLTAGAINQIGVTVLGLPPGKLITIDVPTSKQMQDLHDLGYVTVTLPDGKVVVTADTNPAQQEIQALLNYARSQSIIYRATLPSLVDNSVASGSGRPGAATGGQILGAGSTTSDSIPIMVSNKEFIVNAAATEANLALLHAINSGKIRGFAGGGWTGLSPDGTWPVGSPAIPVHVQDAGYEAGIHKYLSQLTSFSGTGAGSPFIRILGQAIAASMGYGGQFGAIDYIFSRESGWNPMAQNPTSSAFGIPQFLNGTWAQYGGKTTDAAAQIRDGIEYMVNRYGSPAAAASFWAAHHWYHDGGTVSGTPGANVPAMLQVGETVRTTEQEAAVQAVLRSREVGFTSGSGAPTNITVSLAGAHITGRLELGTDGLMTLVDGRIDSEFGALADSLHYSGS